MSFRGIVQQEGFRGLWTGLVPRVARRTLQQALTWTLFEHLVAAFGGEDPSRRATKNPPRTTT